MADPAHVLEEALTLEPADRARVAHELIQSLEESDPDAQALWAQEIRRRIDEIEAGSAQLEDWETVRDRLQAAVRR
jgi:hypothetical protein